MNNTNYGIMLSLKEIQDLLVVPEHHASTPVKVNEAEFLHNFVKDHGLKRTCEVGFAYARSASHIMAATDTPHVAMDPFQDVYGNQGLANLERVGFRDRLEFHNDYSHNVLPALLKEGRTFDFIFIDGDHKFDGEFVDYYYADLLLDSGGYIFMHDTWMRSTDLVMRFIETNRPDYSKIPSPLRNISIYRKVGTDQRDGMHFREFYTRRTLISHNLNMWMSMGKQTPLKRFLTRLKNAIK